MESVKRSIDERELHKREYDIRVNERLMQSKEGKVDSSKALNAGLIVSESNETESERHRLRFALAFWFCDLVLRFGAAFWFCVLLIEDRPFLMGTVREPLAEGTEGAPHLGLERPRIYSDLSSEEKDRYNADIRATNILLEGLPKDIYTLINHYTDAKDIWDNVKMLLEGSELTKEDRESQLYDDFEHFQQHK
nr:integrase, catalytic region, zinc finger, CCHC-type, peptidase aspartic, catalytic [Tanacetum cinerariifolium]